MTLPIWSIPLALTIAIWTWALLAPEPPSRGDYDFSGAFRGLARLAGCIIGTLLFWLVYFMVKSGGLT
jgi:hypothetical protein